MLRRGKIALLTAALLLAAPSLRAQFPPVQTREQLERIAHPATAPGSEQMRFEQLRIATGPIREDDAPATYTFRWHNDGSTPLVVTRVETTCGCAKPAFDKRPVAAGGSGEIAVTYHPKGHPGDFRRKIFVYTQLSEQQPTAVLELTGHAEPSLLPTHDYPHAMGPLRLKRQALRFPGRELQVERIECLNAGDKPLQLRAEPGLLPKYLALACEPEIFEPGRTGDLVIRFDPALAPATLPQQVPILLDGLPLPPSRRTLRIELGNEPK